MKNATNYIVTALLVCVLLGSASHAQTTGFTSASIIPRIVMPIGELNDWYDPVAGVGVNLVYQFPGSRRAEFEYHYHIFAHGAIEERGFVWPVDGRSYVSPNAKANMSTHTLLVNFIFPKNWSMPFANIEPYIMFGSGLYAYTQKVSGLIYPGQGSEPLDQSLLLPPVHDQQVAIGFNFGIGSELSLSSSLALDLRIRYHAILGDMRPFEDWGLQEIFPVQMVDVGVGVRYIFVKYTWSMALSYC